MDKRHIKVLFMKGKELVLRISKVMTAKGHYLFSIKSNIASISEHGIDLPSGKMPLYGSEKWVELRKQACNTFEIILGLANKSFVGTIGVDYKCVFSDKFIATGEALASAHKKVECNKELVMPMNEAECTFIFNCIPTHY